MLQRAGLLPRIAPGTGWASWAGLMRVRIGRKLPIITRCQLIGLMLYYLTLVSLGMCVRACVRLLWLLSK